MMFAGDGHTSSGTAGRILIEVEVDADRKCSLSAGSKVTVRECWPPVSTVLSGGVYVN